MDSCGSAEPAARRRLVQVCIGVYLVLVGIVDQKSCHRSFLLAAVWAALWTLTRRKYGKGIPVGYAFRRIWEGGHGTRSQHYAGVSFDVGQNVSYSQRVAIRNAAVATVQTGYR